VGGYYCPRCIQPRRPQLANCCKDFRNRVYLRNFLQTSHTNRETRIFHRARCGPPLQAFRAAVCVTAAQPGAGNNATYFALLCKRQNPLPKGSAQNAADPLSGFSKNCSLVSPALTALSSAAFKSAT